MNHSYIITALYWLLAFSYVLSANLGDYPLDFLHKALPALLLAFAFVRCTFANHQMIAVAFVFCALGDVLLAIRFQYSFVSGLSTFLIGHLIFAMVFYQWRQWRPLMALWLLVLVVIAAGISIFLLPTTGTLLWPVTLYMLVITLMAISAVLATDKKLLLMLGASTFMLSDMLIGINKFLIPIPFEHIAIMATYYLALYLIAQGIIQRTSVTT